MSAEEKIYKAIFPTGPERNATDDCCLLGIKAAILYYKPLLAACEAYAAAYVLEGVQGQALLRELRRVQGTEKEI